MKATIRLFKALKVSSKRAKAVSPSIMEKTIPMGFIFSPVVAFNYSEAELQRLIPTIHKEIGVSASELNSAFHKSWKKVATASIEQLVMEQIIHYMTTYGFEALGFYDKDSVYIPNEELKIPGIKVASLRLTVIHGLTQKELKKKLMSLLSTGIALKEDTMKDLLEVAKMVGIEESDVDVVQNKEVKTMLYDEFGLVPQNPVEFLRYILYKVTKTTLLIKNKKTVTAIKEKEYKRTSTLFSQYGKQYGLEKLAQIFYRFKPLFLAFKAHPKMKPVINRLRKLAYKHHKPMKPDYLNEVTAKIKKIKKNEALPTKELRTELEKANTFRKIRLAYALKFRTRDVDAILYRVRNGKGYATDFDFKKKEEAQKALSIVLGSIVSDMRKNVGGKKIYIPEHMVYALPATEKQFTGDFPSGTYVKVARDMIAGVHWKNTGKGCDEGRVDLDMSMISAGEKIGWDSSYRSAGADILFSGDMTDAPGPNGATELLYVKRQHASEHIVMLNYFNYSEKSVVPHEIVVASESARNFGMNYMVDPNNVVAVAKTKIDQKQKIIGLITTATTGCRFYFAECYVGNAITSRNSASVENSRKWLFSFYKDTISLNDLLVKAGGKLVDDPKKCDIDLSPEKLEKGKIIELLRSN